jgi:hypothetical protein
MNNWIDEARRVILGNNKIHMHTSTHTHTRKHAYMYSCSPIRCSRGQPSSNQWQHWSGRCAHNHIECASKHATNMQIRIYANTHTCTGALQLDVAVGIQATTSGNTGQAGAHTTTLHVQANMQQTYKHVYTQTRIHVKLLAS